MTSTHWMILAAVLAVLVLVIVVGRRRRRAAWDVMPEPYDPRIPKAERQRDIR